MMSRDVTRSVQNRPAREPDRDFPGLGSGRFGILENPIGTGSGSVCSFMETDLGRFYFMIEVGRFGLLNCFARRGRGDLEACSEL